MNEIIGIFLCLFAAVGLAQCVCWLIARFRPQEAPRVYQIIPLYDDPAQIEVRLRFGINQLEWNCTGDRVILVDMGLGEESRTVCDRFLRRYPGIVLCSPDEVGLMLYHTGQLQEAQESGIL